MIFNGPSTCIDSAYSEVSGWQTVWLATIVALQEPPLIVASDSQIAPWHAVASCCGLIGDNAESNATLAASCPCTTEVSLVQPHSIPNSCSSFSFCMSRVLSGALQASPSHICKASLHACIFVPRQIPIVCMRSLNEHNHQLITMQAAIAVELAPARCWMLLGAVKTPAALI